MTITQAMILAAGKGTRMRPLTLNTPKPLIAVAGQPLIVWHILALKSAGITDITINCAWLADKLQAALADGSQFGVRIHWSVEHGESLETAGGVKKALYDNKLADKPFILVNGDVWTTYDFAKLRNVTMAEDSLAYLLLTDNPEHNPDGDFVLQLGKVLTKDAVATDSQSEGEAYTFAGISIIKPELLADVAVNQPYPLAPVFKEAMNAGKVEAEHMSDKWIDVGTPQRLEDVNNYVANELAVGDGNLHKGKL